MKINKKSGKIEIKNLIIDKFTTPELLEKDNNLKFFGFINGYDVYSNDFVVFLELRMVVNIRFKEKKLSSIELIWKDGVSSNLNYNLEIQEIINEKEKIKNLFNLCMQIKPDFSSRYEDRFTFPWGRLIISADQKSLSCITKIFYENSSDK